MLYGNGPLHSLGVNGAAVVSTVAVVSTLEHCFFPQTKGRLEHNFVTTNTYFD